MSDRSLASSLLGAGAGAAPTLVAACLAVAGCGGSSSTPPVAPAPTTAPTTAAADEPAMEAKGDGYGGAAYGGDSYGAIAQRWQDPCGGPLVVDEPPPPPDPPELATYLPPTPPLGPGPGPDADTVYAVPVHDSPSAGPALAPVTLVTTYELADPYSERLRTTLDELQLHYDKDLRIVWKSFIVHRDRAQVAALGGCAAGKQGKFQPFINAMFDAAMGPSGNRRFDLGAVTKVATATGLDPVKFDADLRSAACRTDVIRDQQLFESLGQRAVPVSWVNGKVVQGAQPTDAFIKIIDVELAAAQKVLAKRGAKAKDFYPNLVKRGKKTP